MPTRQNKVVRLYGPWRGQDDSGSRTNLLDFERCYNVEIEGEEVVTRNGRVRFLTGGMDPVTTLGRVKGSLFAARKGAGAPTLTRVVGASTWTPVALPASVKARDVYSRFAFWDESVVLTGGWGPPLVFNGTRCVELTGVNGSDHATVGAGYVLGALDPAAYAAKYHGRMYMVTLGGTIYFSESESAINIIPADGTAPLGALNVWPAGNNFDAKGSATDEARGCVVFGDQLVLLTRDALFTWDDVQLRRVPGAPGCIAPDSVAVTTAGLVYLAADGLYLFDGSRVRRISDAVQTALRSYVRFAFRGAVGVHYPRRAQYRLYVPASGATENRFALVWDYRENRWWMHGGTPPWTAELSAYQTMAVSCAVVEYPGEEAELLVTGDYSGNLWAEDSGLSDEGRAIYTAIVFDRLGSGEDAGVRVWRDLTLEARASGAPVQVSLLTEGESLAATSAAPSRQNLLLLRHSTWGSNEYPITRTLGGNVTCGPISVWRYFRFPFGVKARNAQPALVCSGVDGAGMRWGGKLAVRGLEIRYRQHGANRERQ